MGLSPLDNPSVPPVVSYAGNLWRRPHASMSVLSQYNDMITDWKLRCFLRMPSAFCAWRGRWSAGQQHFDPHALAGTAADRQQPAMPIEDMLDDGEAEAGHLLLAAVLGIDAIEPLGEAGYVFSLDTGAVVSDGYGIVVAGAAGYRGQRHIHPAAAAAVLDGIVDEVFEDLIELVAVAGDRRSPHRCVDGDGDTALPGLRRQPLRALAQQEPQ